MPEFYAGAKALQDMHRSGRNNALLTRLFPEHKSQEFDPKWIRLGFRRLPNERGYDLKGNEFNLSVKKAERMLWMGKTGSGKTQELRRMADFFHHSGRAVVFLSDIKDEMKSSLRPAPEKFAKLLDPLDMAQPMNMKIYRPVFFMKALGQRLPSDNERFSIAYNDVTFSELLIALGFHTDKSKNQQQELTLLFNKANSLEDLAEIARASVNNPGVRESIMRGIKSLIAVEAFTPDPQGDVVADLHEGKAVVINMSGFDSIGVGSATLPQIYLSIVQRLVVEARKNTKEGTGPLDRRLRRKVAFIIDEAPKFLKPGTFAYDELLKSVDVNRYLGVSMIFAAQTRDRVPDPILNQTRYIFLPFNIEPGSAWEILQRSHFYEWHPDAKKRMSDILRSLNVLPDGRRNWVCIDTEQKTTEIFYAYPALSAHTEE